MQQERPADGGIRWKLMLAALVLFFIAAQVVTMVYAGRKVGRVVEPEYYTKGQQYGETLRRAKAGRPDWTMTARTRSGAIHIVVQDRSGAPVTGGAASIELAGPSSPASLPLVESGPGVYQAAHSFAGSELRGTVRIARGEAMFTEKLVLFR